MAFQESQKMDALWIKALVIIGSLVPLIMVGVQVVKNPDTAVIVTLLFLIAFVAGLYFVVLESTAYTRIDSQGIHYRYPPFVNKWRLIAWNDVEKVEIKGINPIRDYGGFGYRWGRNGNGIILSNNKAIVATLKSGKTFALTTKQEYGATREIDHYFNQKRE